MGKNSKGLIGVKPRSMHEICSQQNTKKKKKQRDAIKMKSYEQIVSRAKVDKIEKTIKDLQTKNRAGRLEHADYIKLMANKKILKKKQEKDQDQKLKDSDLGEYRFTAEEIRTGQFNTQHKTDPLLDDDFGRGLVPGYEPNSSLNPTGISAKARNFVTEGTISKSAVVYSKDEPLQSKPKEIPRQTQVKKDEADPLISMAFENEIIHRRLPKEEKQPTAKPINVVKEEVKEKVSMKRPMFVPRSVRMAKKKKEEPVVQEIKVVQEVKEEKFKPISSVPAPDNLMLFDLSDEDTGKNKDI